MGKKGGARPNAGRKAGGQNKTTIEKKVAEKAMKDRIVQATDMLINAQLGLAKGGNSLMCQKFDNNGKKKGKAFIIEDDDIILQFLNGELDGGRDMYYYMMKKRSDNKAIANLLDRAYGKPKESLDLGVKVKPITILVKKNYAKIPPQQ